MSSYLSTADDCGEVSGVARGPSFSNVSLEEYPLINESVYPSGIEDFPLSDTINGESNTGKEAGIGGFLG